MWARGARGGLALEVSGKSGSDLAADGAVSLLRKPANLSGELGRDVRGEVLDPLGGRFARRTHALPIG